MFLSTIIPTIGRPSLEHAVRSVLDQALNGEFELIVVNDSGIPLPAAGWQSEANVRVIDFNGGNNILARNCGAEAAEGKYLHFLDDDDWLFPGAFSALAAAARENPNAVCLYGGGVLEDENQNVFGSLNLYKDGNCFAELVGGSWIQLGQAITKREIFKRLGGLDASYPIGEENHFFRQAAYLGDFAHAAAPIVHILRGAGWKSAVDYSRSVEYDRISRAACLVLPDAFKKLIDSADTAYWRGRVFKVYLSDGRRGLKNGDLSLSLRRILASFYVILRSGGMAFDREFWKGVQTEHAPNSQPALLDSALF